jgi:hypothetical protein
MNLDNIEWTRRGRRAGIAQNRSLLETSARTRVTGGR